MICCAGEACVGKGLQRVGDAGVLGEARAVVVYMAAVLLSGKTNGLGIASSLDVEDTCWSSPIRSRLGSALKVVLPVPDKPKKIDTPLSGPMFADAWRSSARSQEGGHTEASEASSR